MAQSRRSSASIRLNQAQLATPAGCPPHLDPLDQGNIQEASYHAFVQVQEFLEAFKKLPAWLNHKRIFTDEQAIHFIDKAAQGIQQIGYAVHCFNVSKSRAVEDQYLPLLTTLPDFSSPDQQVNRLPDHRNYKIKSFTGEEKGVDSWCKEFLTRVMEVVVQHNLNETISKKLLLLSCSGKAYREVDGLIKENKTLEDIVRKLETLYCGLKPPEIAREDLTDVKRQSGESLHSLANRIKELTHLICRYRPDAALAQEELNKTTFYQAIDERLIKHLKDLEELRKVGSQAPMNMDDLVFQATRFETRHVVAKAMTRTRSSVENGRLRIRQTKVETVSEQSEEELSPVNTQEQSSDQGSEDTSDQQLLRIRQKSRKPYRKQKKIRAAHEYSPRKRDKTRKKGGRRRSGRVNQVEEDSEQQSQSQDSSSSSSDNESSYEKEIWDQDAQICLVRNNFKRKYQRVQASDLNVTKDECWRCGLTGHFAFGKSRGKCPLNKQPITTTPCTNCNKGGHVAQICPRKRGSDKGGRVYALTEESYTEETDSEGRIFQTVNVVRGPPHVTAIICNKYVDAIVDTGADRTLCRYGIAKQLFGANTDQVMRTSKSSLRSVTGHKLNILGEITMTLELGGLQIKHPVLIADDSVPPFLIGNDFLLNRVSLIKGKTFRIHGNDNEKDIDVPIVYNPKKMVVQTKQREILPPHSTKLIMGRLNIDQGTKDDLLLLQGAKVLLSDIENKHLAMRDLLRHKSGKQYEPVYYSNQGFNITESISRISEDGEVACLLINATEEVVEIKGNELLADADLVIEEEYGIYGVCASSPENETLLKSYEIESVTSEGEYSSQESKYIHFLHSPEDYDLAINGPKKPGKHFPDPTGYEMPEEKKIEYHKIKTKGLSPQQRGKLIRMLQKHDKVFSKGTHDFGKTDLITFHIDTGNSPPIASKYIPVSAKDTPKIMEIIQSMLKNGIIEECNSDWNSTLVPVKKPNGEIRLCINLKNINALTVRGTSYPIKHQDESHIKLSNGKYFFRLDLSQAYYAVPLTEDSKDKTAFSVIGRQYRFICSPFGAKYLPSEFNRLMSIIFKDASDDIFFYFDDIICASQTVNELFGLLDDTLGRIEKANLRVNFEKSDFYLTHLDAIPWLGSIIMNGELHPDPKKIEAITEMPLPHTKRGMQRFMGFVSYLRRHLKGIANIMAPLYKCCKGKETKIKHTPETIKAFNDAKKACTSAKALKLPDMGKKFKLTTDASGVGCGGVLTQTLDDGTEQPVAYCSKVFSEAELKQSACEKELTAVLYAFAKFNYLLQGNHFTLVVDCKGLVFGQFFKGKNPKIYRTFMTFNELDFDVKHESAKKDTVMLIADMLSRAYVEDNTGLVEKASYKILRHPLFEKMDVPEACKSGKVMKKAEFWKHVDKYLDKFCKENKKDLQAIGPHLDQYAKSIADTMAKPFDQEIDLLQEIYDSGIDIPEYGSIYMMASEIEKETPHEDELQTILAAMVDDALFSRHGFQIAQLEDEKWQEKINELNKFKEGHRINKFFLRRGILCKDVEINDRIFPVIVIPGQLVDLILRRYHSMNDTSAHIGRKRMYEQCRATFFWPTMANDIKDFCRKCMICKYQTKNSDPAHILQRAERATRPNEVVNMDIVGPFTASSEGYRYILTIQDDFSKFIVAIPLKTKSAGAVVTSFLKGWVGPFLAPKVLRTDNGTEVDSSPMRTFCADMGIHKVSTPIYSPKCNPIERWHATLAEMMRTWLQQTGNKRQWANIIPLIAQQYNFTPHLVTKVKPAELFLGRKQSENYHVPIVPDDHPHLTHNEYLEEIHKGQKILTEIARRNLEKEAEKQVCKLGRHKEPRLYKIGDKVLVKNYVRGKLDPKFTGPYTVIKVKKNTLEVLRYIDAKELEMHQKLRKQDEADDLGRIEKRVVHVADVKLLDDDTQLQPTWESRLAKKFFRKMKIEYKLEDDNESVSSGESESEEKNKSIRPQVSESSATTKSKKELTQKKQNEFVGPMTRSRAKAIQPAPVEETINWTHTDEDVGQSDSELPLEWDAPTVEEAESNEYESINLLTFLGNSSDSESDILESAMSDERLPNGDPRLRELLQHMDDAVYLTRRGNDLYIVLPTGRPVPDFVTRMHEGGVLNLEEGQSPDGMEVLDVMYEHHHILDDILSNARGLSELSELNLDDFETATTDEEGEAPAQPDGAAGEPGQVNGDLPAHGPEDIGDMSLIPEPYHRFVREQEGGYDLISNVMRTAPDLLYMLWIVAHAQINGIDLEILGTFDSSSTSSSSSSSEEEGYILYTGGEEQRAPTPVLQEVNQPEPGVEEPAGQQIPDTEETGINLVMPAVMPAEATSTTAEGPSTSKDDFQLKTPQQKLKDDYDLFGKKEKAVVEYLQSRLIKTKGPGNQVLNQQLPFRQAPPEGSLLKPVIHNQHGTLTVTENTLQMAIDSDAKKAMVKKPEPRFQAIQSRTGAPDTQNELTEVRRVIQTPAAVAEELQLMERRRGIEKRVYQRCANQAPGAHMMTAGKVESLMEIQKKNAPPKAFEAKVIANTIRKSGPDEDSKTGKINFSLLPSADGTVLFPKRIEFEIPDQPCFKRRVQLELEEKSTGETPEKRTCVTQTTEAQTSGETPHPNVGTAPLPTHLRPLATSTPRKIAVRDPIRHEPEKDVPLSTGQYVDDVDLLPSCFRKEILKLMHESYKEKDLEYLDDLVAFHERVLYHLKIYRQDRIYRQYKLTPHDVPAKYAEVFNELRTIRALQLSGLELIVAPHTVENYRRHFNIPKGPLLATEPELNIERPTIGIYCMTETTSDDEDDTEMEPLLQPVKVDEEPEGSESQDEEPEGPEAQEEPQSQTQFLEELVPEIERAVFRELASFQQSLCIPENLLGHVRFTFQKDVDKEGNQIIELRDNLVSLFRKCAYNQRPERVEGGPKVQIAIEDYAELENIIGAGQTYDPHKPRKLDSEWNLNQEYIDFYLRKTNLPEHVFDELLTVFLVEEVEDSQSQIKIKHNMKELCQKYEAQYACLDMNALLNTHHTDFFLEEENPYFIHDVTKQFIAELKDIYGKPSQYTKGVRGRQLHKEMNDYIRKWEKKTQFLINKFKREQLLERIEKIKKDKKAKQAKKAPPPKPIKPFEKVLFRQSTPKSSKPEIHTLSITTPEASPVRPQAKKESTDGQSQWEIVSEQQIKFTHRSTGAVPKERQGELVIRLKNKNATKDKEESTKEIAEQLTTQVDDLTTKKDNEPEKDHLSYDDDNDDNGHCVFLMSEITEEEEEEVETPLLQRTHAVRGEDARKQLLEKYASSLLQETSEQTQVASSSNMLNEQRRISELSSAVDNLGIKYMNATRTPTLTQRSINSTAGQSTEQAFIKLMNSYLLTNKEKEFLKRTFEMEKRRSEYTKTPPTLYYNGKALAEWNEIDCRSFLKHYESKKINPDHTVGKDQFSKYPLIAQYELLCGLIHEDQIEEKIEMLTRIYDLYTEVQDEPKRLEYGAKIAQFERKRLHKNAQPIPSPRSSQSFSSQRGEGVDNIDRTDDQNQQKKTINSPNTQTQRSTQKKNDQMEQFMFQSEQFLHEGEENYDFYTEQKDLLKRAFDLLNAEQLQKYQIDPTDNSGTVIKEYLERLFAKKLEAVEQYNALYSRYLDISIVAKEVIGQKSLSQLYKKLKELDSLCLIAKNTLLSDLSHSEKVQYCAEQLDDLNDWSNTSMELIQNMDLDSTNRECERWNELQAHQAQYPDPSQLEKQIAEKMASITEIQQNNLDPLKKRLQDSSDLLFQKKQELVQVQQDINQKNDEVEDVEKQRDDLKEQLKQMTHYIQQEKKTIEELQRQNEKVSEEKSQILMESELKHETQIRLKKPIEQLVLENGRMDQEIEQLKKQLTLLKEENEEHQTKFESVKKDYDKKKERLNNIQGDIRRLSIKTNQLTSERREMDEEHGHVMRKYVEVQHEVDRLQREIDDKKHEVKMRKIRQKELNGSTQTLTEHINSLDSSIEALRSKELELQHTRQTTETEYEQLLVKTMDLQKQTFQLQKDLEAAEQQFRDKTDEFESLKQRKRECSLEFSNLLTQANVEHDQDLGKMVTAENLSKVIDGRNQQHQKELQEWKLATMELQSQLRRMSSGTVDVPTTSTANRDVYRDQEMASDSPSPTDDVVMDPVEETANNAIAVQLRKSILDHTTSTDTTTPNVKAIELGSSVQIEDITEQLQNENRSFIWTGGSRGYPRGLGSPMTTKPLSITLPPSPPTERASQRLYPALEDHSTRDTAPPTYQEATSLDRALVIRAPQNSPASTEVARTMSPVARFRTIHGYHSSGSRSPSPNRPASASPVERPSSTDSSKSGTKRKMFEALELRKSPRTAHDLKKKCVPRTLSDLWSLPNDDTSREVRGQRYNEHAVDATYEKILQDIAFELTGNRIAINLSNFTAEERDVLNVQYQTLFNSILKAANKAEEYHKRYEEIYRILPIPDRPEYLLSLHSQLPTVKGEIEDLYSLKAPNTDYPNHVKNRPEDKQVFAKTCYRLERHIEAYRTARRSITSSLTQINKKNTLATQETEPEGYQSILGRKQEFINKMVQLKYPQAE